MSTQNQGPRLKVGKKAPMTKGSGGIHPVGKVARNPMKPKLAAKIKNSQGLGGGLKQRFQPGKVVTNARGRGGKTGVAQRPSDKLASKRVTGRPGKTNLKRISAQPKGPKNNSIQPKNNFTLHNNVGPGDVARLRKASAFPPVKMGGGGFKSFIGGK